MKGALKSLQFRQEREANWSLLESLVETVERKGPGGLDAEDTVRLATLYRAALSGLSVARAISLDRNVVEYLEQLCARAYLVVYGAKRDLRRDLSHFVVWLPRQMRAIKWHLLLATLFMGSGFAAGFLLVLGDMDLYYSLMGDSGGRDPASSTAFLRSTLYDDGGGLIERLITFASFLFTHNARIGIWAFGLGFMAGVPVFLLLFKNGLSLGAFAALFHARGLSVELWAWLLPHGITEIFAIIVCGAAGLMLGQAVLFPGDRGRLERLAERGQAAAGVVLGAVCLFFVAGLIEGIFRQTVQDVTIRYGVAAVTAAALSAYFLLVGRGKTVIS